MQTLKLACIFNQRKCHPIFYNFPSNEDLYTESTVLIPKDQIFPTAHSWQTRSYPAWNTRHYHTLSSPSQEHQALSHTTFTQPGTPGTITHYLHPARNTRHYHTLPSPSQEHQALSHTTFTQPGTPGTITHYLHPARNTRHYHTLPSPSQEHQALSHITFTQHLGLKARPLNYDEVGYTHVSKGVTVDEIAICKDYHILIT